MDRTRIALEEMAEQDPQLAARLVLQTLPAAAKRLDGVRYDMTVGELGTWHVSREGVERGGGDGADFHLDVEPAALAELAAGASPVGLMLRGKLRIRGN